MNRIKLLLASLTVLGLAGGCSPSAGTVTLKLTDAPGDFKKAVVTIDAIYLHGSAEGEGNDGKGVSLLHAPVTTDLLTLANDTADLVKHAVVPAGTYSELRFVISGGYVEVEQADGTTKIFASSPDYAGLPDDEDPETPEGTKVKVDGPLQMPSYASSGLKVKLSEHVDISGEQKVLLVDFSVAESFGHAAGSEKWVMKPVIKAAELMFSGSVEATLRMADGVTIPPVGDTQVTLGDFVAVLSRPAEDAAGNPIVAEEKLALTDADGDGTFEAHFKWLFPGNQYSLTFEAPVNYSTNPGTPASVTVGSGQELTQAFLLTSASLK
ncbi:MAG: DUF4382 domain-containing protein [Myxococcaceae bacterium]|nr:DUF4382 domain-containing protein [Myxococcaceae bacterium]MCI0669268.1 DUF4382 domain-containing protein [Myxococcaceae bacterium]